VLAVGSSADMEPLIGPGTRIVELRGRLATPGLFEAHAHLLPMGISMAEIDARPQNADTLDALLGLIREAAASKKPGEWILARGYDDSKLDIRRHPHRTELDLAAPDNPVYLVRTCGHLAVANSMALKIAGVTTKSPVPAAARSSRSTATSPA
jgi:predicted amidohydrolase YtcJ